MKWGFAPVVQGRLNRERLAKGHKALIAATSEDFDPDPVVMDSAIPSSVSASALVNERGRVQEVSRESSSTCGHRNPDPPSGIRHRRRCIPACPIA